MAETILSVQHLKTWFYNSGNIVRAADDLSYEVKQGECVAIIGESGSGKSVSALSVMRLIPYPPGIIAEGKIIFQGEDILQMDNEEVRKLRGNRIGMIFQDPNTSLDPVMTIGNQICEAIRTHHPEVSKREAKERAIELLRSVNIPNPEQRIRQYPFEFSGGMQQRAMIAMAICCEPDLIIADEPTTALDVTVQAQVLDVLDNLRKKNNSSLIIITHNLGIVARYADQVKIMYGGKIVEEGDPVQIFYEPRHPYTKGLIRAVPRLDKPKSYGLKAIQGEAPDMGVIPPDSCAFAPRCQYATEECRCHRPPLCSDEAGHGCACFHWEEILKSGGDTP